ncbi:MAG TPA: TolC family protein [Bacteroidia bacterium]|jgi:outer membrane protein TolC|nr:TolC family protein [Bacteroidia bacterium]
MNPIFKKKEKQRDRIYYLRQIIKSVIITIAFTFGLPQYTQAQQNKTADTVPNYTLDQCIVFALQNQPALLQSSIDVTIAQKTNDINLSGWLPQAYLTGSLTHYIELPTSVSENPSDPTGPPVPVKAGIYNTATPQLSVTENIFSPGLLYAAKSAHLLVQQAQQANDSSKINIIATVSKAFYNMLNNLEQINVLKEDTARQGRNVRDAYHQYIGGIVDKTDYKEATITLNNSKAQLKQATENARPLYASLKQLMGYPQENKFNVVLDTAQMMHEIMFDTTQKLQYENRIEFQMIETTKTLQHENVNYYRYNFLPTLSAFYDYDHEFESNSFSTLFQQAYPYSYIGASISIPLFTGFARIEGLQRAKLQGQKIDLQEVNLKSSIYSEYTAALASYKSNLYNLLMLKDNVAMAKDVYNVVTLQYKQGIVPYLNVITAEDNLVSSETSYINSLFQLLVSKVDLEKALGNISPKH